MDKPKITVLLCSNDVILITKTINYYQMYSKQNVEFVSIDNAENRLEFKKVPDLIIADSPLLLESKNGVSFGQFLSEKNIFAPIIVLETEISKPLPSALNICNVVSYPVQPKKLWRYIDDMLNNKSI